jgi:hypothetical protein
MRPEPPRLLLGLLRFFVIHAPHPNLRAKGGLANFPPYDGQAICISARCLVHGSPAGLKSLLVYRDAGAFSSGLGLPTPDELVNRIVR